VDGAINQLQRTLRISGSVLLLISAIADSSFAQHQIARLDTNYSFFAGGPGESVSLEGTTAIVSGGFLFISEVFVFERDASGWNVVQRLDGGSQGARTDLHGDWLAVGREWESDVDLYRRHGGWWTQQSKLLPGDPDVFGLFGHSVDLDGSRLAVGRPWDDLPTAGIHEGSVYLFQYDETSGVWSQEAKLTAAVPQLEALFGMSLALEGDTLVVGAPLEDSGIPPVHEKGAVYLFERSAGSWQQRDRLTVPELSISARLGFDVALEGTTILAGAPGAITTSGTWSGEAIVFQNAPSGWAVEARLAPHDPTQFKRFGHSVALSDDYAVIGAPFEQAGGHDLGAAYHFQRKAEAWIQAGKLLAVDSPLPTNHLELGYDVAIDGDFVLAGAPTQSTAYLFHLGVDAEQVCSCPLPHGPCGNPDSHGGCTNSVGEGAVLSASGSGSVSLDDLRLESRWMPSDQPCVVFMGPDDQQVPFGDGLLCVGSGGLGLFRIHATTTGTAGLVTLGPDLVAGSHANLPPAGHIQPGQAWTFQCWFRDPGGPCGTDSNLSNAVRVLFGP
jgi:hypothetical protein